MEIISCKLCGGLGNQLFQIYTTIAYSMKCQKPFKFLRIKQLGNGANGSTIRYTYWDTFLSALNPFLVNIGEIPKLVYIMEPNFTYNELPIKIERGMGTLLVGYFQSPKYFQNYSELIYRLLKIEQKKTEVKNKIRIDFENTNTISIHFRFGDYKKYPDVYPLLDENYYIKALAKSLDEIRTQSNPQVLYFCEEESIEEAEDIIKNLKSNFPNLRFFRAGIGMEDWEQMLLMSCCLCNIIANSTFSWWGAYLNTNPNKVVCYPDQWFTPEANKDTSDLFLENWIKIS